MCGLVVIKKCCRKEQADHRLIMKAFIRNSWHKIITEIKLRKLFPISRLNPIIAYNRRTLTKIDNWIEDSVYNNSIYSYGLPVNVKHLINRDIDNKVTYSDVIIYLTAILNKRINYLELGVSVGKNLFQIVNYVESSNVTGFDIEEINPKLEEYLVKKKRFEWVTIKESQKKDKSSLTEYFFKPKQNVVNYVSADIYDENAWRLLSGNKYNIVFSDALHSPSAVLYEYDMINKYQLLDSEEFIMIWDDLNGEMEKSFNVIWNDLRLKHNLKAANKIRILLNGWLNLKVHEVGIIIKSNNQSHR
jgi:hypothetical protein